MHRDSPHVVHVLQNAAAGGGLRFPAVPRVVDGQTSSFSDRRQVVDEVRAVRHENDLRRIAEHVEVQARDRPRR